MLRNKAKIVPLFIGFVLIAILLKKVGQKQPKGPLVVPNIIHFALLKDDNTTEAEVDFVSATCILAAFFNQNPNEIYLHTNVQNITGKYWNIIKPIISSVLKVKTIERPTHVFGSPLSSIFHSADVARIKLSLIHI